MSQRLALGVVLLWAIVPRNVMYGLAQSPVAADNQASYDTRYDNVDIDEVLGQERLLRNYVKCLENKGPCTPDAKMLKETLPDAIASDCMKCSEKQKYSAQKITHFLIDNRPEDWTRLESIYDPQGNYRQAYMLEKQTTTIKP